MLCVALLQTSLLQHNELMALSPKEMQQKISELLVSNPDIAEVVSAAVVLLSAAMFKTEILFVSKITCRILQST